MFTCIAFASCIYADEYAVRAHCMVLPTLVPSATRAISKLHFPSNNSNFIAELTAKTLMISAFFTHDESGGKDK